MVNTGLLIFLYYASFSMKKSGSHSIEHRVYKYRITYLIPTRFRSKYRRRIPIGMTLAITEKALSHLTWEIWQVPCYTLEIPVKAPTLGAHSRFAFASLSTDLCGFVGTVKKRLPPLFRRRGLRCFNDGYVFLPFWPPLLKNNSRWKQIERAFPY